jgi:hypothetical protein
MILVYKIKALSTATRELSLSKKRKKWKKPGQKVLPKGKPIQFYKKTDGHNRTTSSKFYNITFSDSPKPRTKRK